MNSNITRVFVASYSIMESGEISSYPHGTAMFVNHYGMVSVGIIIIQDNNLWGSRKRGQINIISSIVY